MKLAWLLLTLVHDMEKHALKYDSATIEINAYGRETRNQLVTKLFKAKDAIAIISMNNSRPLIRSQDAAHEL